MAAPGAPARPQLPTRPGRGTGPREDTLLLPPMGAADVDLAAANPGRWMLHGHNAHHAEAGMMTRLDYT